jgi:hypothetical protein
VITFIEVNDTGPNVAPPFGIEFEGTNCVICSTCIGPHLAEDDDGEWYVWTLVWRSRRGDFYCEDCVNDIGGGFSEEFTPEQQLEIARLARLDSLLTGTIMRTTLPN